MTQPSSAPNSDPLRFALAEYESLREESGQARQAQQTILSWSIGAIAVVIAGGLATIGKESNNLDLVRLGVTGFVLPGLIFGSALAWTGEMIRMERVGFYLRARERALWPPSERHQEEFTPNWITDPSSHPTLWENFIAFGGKAVGERKQAAGYLGGMLIYVGSLLASLFVFGWILHLHDFDRHDEALTWAGYAWAGFAAAVPIAVLLLLTARLVRISKRAAGIEFGSPPAGDATAGARSITARPSSAAASALPEPHSSASSDS